MTPPPPRSTLFPYTTLFRSRTALAALHEVARRDQMAADAAGDRRHHMRELDIELGGLERDRKSTRLNSSHITISYAVFCLKKKNKKKRNKKQKTNTKQKTTN